jgi:hypothetical protein
MMHNPWVHGTWRRCGLVREAEVCGVSSMRRSLGARWGEDGGAQIARARRNMRMKMAQDRGIARRSGTVLHCGRCGALVRRWQWTTVVARLWLPSSTALAAFRYDGDRQRDR